MCNDHCKVLPGPICPGDIAKVKEAVCVQVEKVYDQCREKDCIEDAKVIFKGKCIQKIINNAINVKVRKAEVVDVYADVEPVPFKRGFYTVDVKYFIIVTLDFFVPGVGPIAGPITRRGLVVFDKKIILFGSEGNVKIFKSKFVSGGSDKPFKTRLEQDNLPISKVEVAEPIALNAKIQDIADKYFDNSNDCDRLATRGLDLLGEDTDEAVGDLFQDIEDLPENLPLQRRRIVVTLGLFSIIKLERFVQLLIPAFDFCIPYKECIASTEENPCELFETIDFPVNEFFPPQMHDFPGAVEAEIQMGGETNPAKHHRE